MRVTQPSNERVPVAVLGATGIVGQRLVRMLDGHPSLRLASVAASARRAGERYGDAVRWSLGGDPPAEAADLPLRVATEPPECRIALSALPSGVARELEPALAGAGHIVSTNASAHRLRPDVPLLVPEVNPQALALAAGQPWSEGGGRLIANPNCVVAGLALALAPLQDAFGIETATVVTLQAVTGAGLTGVGSVQIEGNTIPWIPGEEEKIEPELNKILGTEIDVAVSVNRVPVLDGHTANVFLKFASPATPRDAARALEDFRAPLSLPRLPSLPDRPLVVRPEPDRPQPRLDIGAAGGMAASVGRIRAAPPHDLAMTVVAHNGVRGAAGACLANAEFCARIFTARETGLNRKEDGDP
ncbi:MAG: aspartate-semialdehyde dehydrogenase [Gemmatimonadales bacterium]|nr:aspartate-semialdehyde dehydrogenase [Candidatus Palauibacter denitrificans]